MPRIYRKVVRANRWHSVRVDVRMVHPMDGGGREMWLAAVQHDRWNGTWLSKKAAIDLAAVLVAAADLLDEGG